MDIRAKLALVALVGGSALWADYWFTTGGYIPADISRQSDFFRRYDPVPLLNSFRAGCMGGPGVGTGSSSSAGFRFLNDVRNVAYTRTARIGLCSQDQYPSVVKALHRNVVSALGYAGCQIVSDGFSSGLGVRIVYRCGMRSDGSVTSGPRQQSGGLPAFLTLQMDEEWNVRDPL